MANNPSNGSEFQPYVPATDTQTPEFTVRAVVMGAIFGVLFGAATVYLALKAGLTVSASIPIAVLAISIGRALFRTSILENNIIQTTGSAGESVAAGVAFTLPAFLFLSSEANGGSFFSYSTVMMLAIFGGILGTLMMIPLRRSLIVKEHATLPYPEGTACAHVLIAGEKGGSFARTAYFGLASAIVYATCQKLFHLIAETPRYTVGIANKYLPSGTVMGEITPEYLGVGYIIGPRISGVLVAGGVLAWLGMIPLISTIVPAETIAAQLEKVNPSRLAATGWNSADKSFSDWAMAIYYAYIRQIGAGAVAAAGFITLIKTLPTIVASFRESVGMLGRGRDQQRVRTENDLPFSIVILGCLALVGVLTVMPNIPGDTIPNKVILGVLIIVFGFFFVTVASRIVGIIGASNSPISGMTIATIMGTALVFLAFNWTGAIFEPMALVVGSMICIAAANAGATSQDLKTGYIVGATPRYQQIGLFIGVVVAALVIGFTVKTLDTPTLEMQEQGIEHAIGTEKYPAPQATLMATLIKGLFSQNLDWQFILVGIFLAITLELCGVKSLSFAVGLYLPLSTTLPIWIGGLIRGFSEWLGGKKNNTGTSSELGKGSLFATGLVAGGALFGVIIALSSASSTIQTQLKTIDMHERLTNWLGQTLFPFVSSSMARMTGAEWAGTEAQVGAAGYQIVGICAFALLGLILFIVSRGKQKEID